MKAKTCKTHEPTAALRKDLPQWEDSVLFFFSHLKSSAPAIQALPWAPGPWLNIAKPPRQTNGCTAPSAPRRASGSSPSPPAQTGRWPCGSPRLPAAVGHRGLQDAPGTGGKGARTPPASSSICRRIAARCALPTTEYAQPCPSAAPKPSQSCQAQGMYLGYEFPLKAKDLSANKSEGFVPELFLPQGLWADQELQP